MSKIEVSIFVEDVAHEKFITALIKRICREKNISLAPRIGNSRGGHGQVISEYKLFLNASVKGRSSLPDILVVAVDSNCSNPVTVKNDIIGSTNEQYQHLVITACPDPHIEKWYMSDIISFKQVTGADCSPEERKCERKYYKNKLLKCLRNAGITPTLGGIEFAEELVDAMNIYRAGKAEPSLKSFVDEFKKAIERLQNK